MKTKFKLLITTLAVVGLLAGILTAYGSVSAQNNAADPNIVLPLAQAATTYTVTNTADSGAGSLRQAILDANANAGADVIDFDITGGGVRTIQPQTALPSIDDPVTIDGTTQPGYAAGSLVIELDGTLAGAAGVHGLNIASGSDGSTIRGLAINRFSANGINIAFSGGNNIQNNYIGTNATASAGLGNGGRGIGMLFASGNTIDANVLSANVSYGLFMVFSSGNTITNNFVGTDPTGTIDLGSTTGSGIILIRESNGNTIRGNFSAFNAQNGLTIVSDDNIIEHNTFVDNVLIGITLASGADRNYVAHNLIGTDEQGTPRGNDNQGIGVFTAYLLSTPADTGFALNIALNSALFGLNFNGPQDNTITKNTIAYNKVGGVVVGGDTGAAANASNVHPDVLAALLAQNTISRNNSILENSIFSNDGLGIELSSNLILTPVAGFPLDVMFVGADGVAANDVKDEDVGPNDLQNYPTMNYAKLDDDELRIHGQLKSERDKTYHVEFFATPAAEADPSGHGEGKLFLGSITVDTNQGGNTNIDVVLENISGVALGDVVTATATELISTGPNVYGGTSEFSAATAVTSP